MLMDPGVLLIIGLPVLIYFMMLRPQQKRESNRREIVRSLTEGDEVVTNAGIHGVIVEVETDVVWVEVAPGVELKIVRDAIFKRAQPSLEESDSLDESDDSKSTEGQTSNAIKEKD